MLLLMVFVACGLFAAAMGFLWVLDRRRRHRERSPNFRRRRNRTREPLIKIDRTGERPEDPDL
ncbi:Flp pilus assembly protein TadB [Rhodoligotrophos appendicifer]